MVIPANRRGALRRAINQYLRTATSLEAFLLDCFPRTARALSSGMDRMAQVNLLFSMESEAAILHALEEQLSDDPQALAQLRADLGVTGFGATPMPPESAEPRPAQDQPPLLFIEYDDEDRALVEELLRQLSPLEKAGRLRTFERRQIRPGVDWQAAMAAQLLQAAVIVPLISPDLLAGERFAGFAAQAQQLAKKGRRLIPLLARPALWEQTELGKLEPLPANRRFLSARSRNEREQALVEIAQALIHAVEQDGLGAGLLAPPEGSKPQPLASPMEGVTLPPKKDPSTLGFVAGQLSQTRKRAPFIGAGVVVVLLGIGGWGFLRGGQKDAEKTPAPAATNRQADAPAPRPHCPHWSIKTTPPAAQVLRAADQQELGQTPWSFDPPAGSGEQVFIVRLKGYQDQTLHFRDTADSDQAVLLERKLEPKKEVRAKAAPKPTAESSSTSGPLFTPKPWMNK